MQNAEKSPYGPGAVAFEFAQVPFSPLGFLHFTTLATTFSSAAPICSPCHVSAQSSCCLWPSVCATLYDAFSLTRPRQRSIRHHCDSAFSNAKHPILQVGKDQAAQEFLGLRLSHSHHCTVHEPAGGQGPGGADVPLPFNSAFHNFIFPVISTIQVGKDQAAQEFLGRLDSDPLIGAPLTQTTFQRERMQEMDACALRTDGTTVPLG